MGRRAEEIVADIDRIVAIGRSRREAAADDAIRGLRPADTDWMSEDEIVSLGRLQAELALASPTIDEYRKRVEEKRRARRRGSEIDSSFAAFLRAGRRREP